MSRFIRFFKKLFVPVLTHDASREAKERIKIAQSIPEDQIFVHTIRNALKVEDASLSDKLTFAFTSLPDAQTNFTYAKNLFFDILEFLMNNDEITSEEVNLFKSQLKSISSLEALMMMAT
ncbi:MAG: hypothetical protein ACXADY_01025 [Candidatus Hodarchaeales archaeon]|jgi:hypothetical protein